MLCIFAVIATIIYAASIQVETRKIENVKGLNFSALNLFIGETVEAAQDLQPAGFGCPVDKNGCYLQCQRSGFEGGRCELIYRCTCF